MWWTSNKTKRLFLGFPTKIQLSPVSTRNWSQYASDSVCLAWEHHAVEGSPTQQDCHGKEKGSKHGIRCYIHSDSVDEALKEALASSRANVLQSSESSNYTEEHSAWNKPGNVQIQWRKTTKMIQCQSMVATVTTPHPSHHYSPFSATCMLSFAFPHTLTLALSLPICLQAHRSRMPQAIRVSPLWSSIAFRFPTLVLLTISV